MVMLHRCGMAVNELCSVLFLIWLQVIDFSAHLVRHLSLAHCQGWSWLACLSRCSTTTPSAPCFTSTVIAMPSRASLQVPFVMAYPNSQIFLRR